MERKDFINFVVEGLRAGYLAVCGNFVISNMLAANEKLYTSISHLLLVKKNNNNK